MDIMECKELPVTAVKGVGAERAKLLSKLGIESVYDLLYFFPREYEDRSKGKHIAELEDGDIVTLYAMVATKAVEKRIRPGFSLCKFGIKDQTGNASIVFYNQPFIKNTLKLGQWYYFYGKVTKNFGMAEMQTPTYDKEAQGLVPLYALTKGLSQNILRHCIKEALHMVTGLQEYLPEWLRAEYGLCDIQSAIQGIHFPETAEETMLARKRLIFEELLILQLSLFQMRNQMKEEVNGFAFQKVPELEALIQSLPFALTEDQKEVFREIETDMESSRVMNRLVQGDVGSGKTIVAVLAMVKAVKSGYQAAYMAPTEILAEQHLRNISVFLTDTGIRVRLLKGGQTKKQREEILEEIREGEADIVVGTHALIQSQVAFRNLGLVITDEQHRFGVRQRAMLADKAQGVPDVLVMTATPIPRTLALILYGDLDISVIRSMPKGRVPIQTYVVEESMRQRIHSFIRKQVQEGRQVYIVCPAIEEKEEITSQELLELKKAEEYYREITTRIFPDIPAGLVHGKLRNTEKEAAMRAFSAGETKILVATTVIEVGVDVPNASLIVIENAERFGLAQLHQLRGRVGRGAYQSYCVLFNQSKSQVSKERMKVMAETADGFVIAQKDLEIRGPGEFFGTRQHGLPILRIANLYEDTDVLKDAQKAAGYLLENEYKLNEQEKNGINRLIMGLQM